MGEVGFTHGRDALPFFDVIEDQAQVCWHALDYTMREEGAGILLPDVHINDGYSCVTKFDVSSFTSDSGGNLMIRPLDAFHYFLRCHGGSS